MPATYEPIATTTLGSAAANIEFSGIGSTYTDLRVILVGKGDADGNQVVLNFNNLTGSAYSRTFLQGDGSTATSSRNTSQSKIQLHDAYRSPLNWGLITIDVFSYAGSINKTVLITSSDDRNGSGVVYRAVGLWRNTSAITTIDLTCEGGNFVAGTTATLFGIKAA